jgi:hypothetical protein
MRARSPRDREQATLRNAVLVDEPGAAEPSTWLTGLRQQVYLGDDAIVSRVQARA